MKTFVEYAAYYDLLYKDKDYDSEAKYVYNALKQVDWKGSSILELGCGTGVHAEHLARLGCSVAGIDISEGMLNMANSRLVTLTPEIRKMISFTQGDVRSFDACRTFDAVISLFHVASYQTTNDDISRFFKTARRHLEPGGVLFFDCWYGPGVLMDRPVTRIKRLSNGTIDITRLAEADLNVNTNTVDVHYEILIREKQGSGLSSLMERHRMRYFFEPEIELILKHEGFSLINTHEWMTEKRPTASTWNACFLCRAV